MNVQHLPQDSILHAWLDALSITEVPLSYQISTGLSALGCVLRRNVWVDQENWQVYPNLSVLLVGPSGIGKDTAIDAVEAVIDHAGVPIIGGRTMETVYEQMLMLGDPAVCYIPAPEVTSFLGSKDYQQGMVQELTDLLSTKAYKDVTTKTTFTQSGGKKRILRPTITMHAGSTEEWLHKAMPEGSLEGGLWPRFLIVREEYGSKFIPLPGALPTSEKVRARKGKQVFFDATIELMKYFKRPDKMTLGGLATERYTNWYINRFKYFSPTVMSYANRSRDQVLRLAMLCAASRFCKFIDGQDVTFGIEMMNSVAKAIERAVKPPTREAQVIREILPLLPATFKTLALTLQMYDSRTLSQAIQALVDTQRIVKVGTEFRRCE
jgi:energy-coupling factor transporter ATP-binding protein EcfA2